MKLIRRQQLGPDVYHLIDRQGTGTESGCKMCTARGKPYLCFQLSKLGCKDHPRYCWFIKKEKKRETTP